MIGAIVLFLLAILFAVRFDRDDLLEWAYLPIMSNQSDQSYRYLISVIHYSVTGSEQIPKVSISLKGNIQTTPWRVLDDGKRKNFNGKRPANFMLSTCVSAGRLEAVKLRLETALPPAEGKKMYKMHIDKIIIVDVREGRKYIFPAKQKLQANQQCRIELSTEDDVKAFRYLISQNSRVGLTDLHPWLSIAKRPLPSNWTRAERLGVVVAALFMAMLVNTMFYGQEAASPKVGINVGGFFRISWFTIWTSLVGSIIIIPPTSIMAFIFKKIKRRSAETSLLTTVFNIQLPPGGETGDEHSKKRPLQLPFWCAIIAWLLCGVCVAVSAFFIIMYSLTWGREKSLQWLVSMVLHVIQDIILIQTIKVFVTSLCTSTFLSMPDDGLNIGRLTFARENTKRRAEMFLRMRNMMAGIFHHIIFVIAFALVIGTAHNNFCYKQVRDLKPLVDVDGGTGSLGNTGFGKHRQLASAVGSSDIIEDHVEIYDWLYGSLLPNFLSGNQLAYGGIFPNWKMYNIPNHDVVLMGPIRLRQQRTTQDLCQLQSSVVLSYVQKYADGLANKSKVLCQRPYFDNLGIGDSSERRNFNGSWQLDNTIGSFSNQEIANLSANQVPWIYRETDGIPYVGRQGQYKSGGYYVDLPLSLTKAKAVVADLLARRWLDNSTTVFFVDFTLYNAQVNMFIAVKVVFEALNAGGMSYHKWLYPLNLYQYSGDNAMMVYAIQAVWILVLLSHTVKIAIQVKKQGFRQFRQDGWNVFNLLEMLFSWVIVGIFAVRIMKVISTVNQIQNDRYSFVDMDMLVCWEDLMLNMYGISFFMAMLLFFRHLTSNKFWAMFLAVLSHGKADILSFVFMFVVVTVLFAGLGYGTLGTTTEEFRSFTAALMTLIQNVIGVVGPLIHLANTSRFVMAFCFAYSMIVMFMAVQVFMTIINVVYSYVANDVEATTAWDSELADYMSEEWKKLLHQGRTNVSNEEFEEPPPSQLAQLDSCDKALRASDNLVKAIDERIKRENRKERTLFIWLAEQEFQQACKINVRRPYSMNRGSSSGFSAGLERQQSANNVFPATRQPPYAINVPEDYWAYLHNKLAGNDNNTKL